MAHLLFLNGMPHELDAMDATGTSYSEAILEGMRVQTASSDLRMLRLAALPLPLWSEQAPTRRDTLGTSFDELVDSVATAQVIVLLAPAWCGALSGSVKNVFDLLSMLPWPMAPACRATFAGVVNTHGPSGPVATQTARMFTACGLAPLAEAPTMVERTQVRDSRQAGRDAMRSMQRLGIAATLRLHPAREWTSHDLGSNP